MNPMGVAMLLTGREWTRLRRQPFRAVATVATPLIFLAALGSGFAGSLASLSDGGYAGFLLPGVIAMAGLFAAAFASMSLIEDRDSGLLLALLAGPTPKPAIGLGKAIGVISLAVVQSAVLLPAAYAVGLRPDPLSMLLAFGVLVMLCAGVVGCSLAIAWRCPDSQTFHAMMNVVLLPAWMLAGAFYPAEQAAGVMRGLTLADPLAWPVASLRWALTGDDALPGPPGLWLALTAVFAAVGLTVAALAARRTP
ncbi:MAG: ABC transporter permease [Planctomycetota bacterium]